ITVEAINDAPVVSDTKKKGFFDNFIDTIFGTTSDKKTSENKKNKIEKKEIVDKNIKLDDNLELRIKELIKIPDSEFNDKLLTQEIRQYLVKMEKRYVSTLSDYKSHIAPSFWELRGSNFNLSGMFGKTYYASSYPSYIDFLWTRDILGFYGKWDASWFIYPGEDVGIQGMLKKRATQLKAEISDAQSKGITIDTEVEVEYRDVMSIRQKLATREERYFEGSFYFTVYHENEEKLNENAKKIEQKIGGLGIKIKPATQRMDEGFLSSVPFMKDELGIYRSMVTTSLAGSFPFISNDLIDNDGIFYGVNLHTGSLVIFDRFSKKLPNANSVVLATSGAGKSFTVKLEILRYLLHNIDIIVIDPDNEYKGLINQVGGTYVNIAVNSNQYLNPFDLPPKIEDIDYKKGDLLRSQIMSLIGLITVLIGGVTPEEEALLDKAIQATYSIKGLTFETENPEGITPPIMGDLMNILEGMDGGDRLAIKISKYVTGTFGNLFNNQTNVDLNSGLTVFSIRDLEDALKTPAMYNILNFIWTKVRSHKKKRLLIVDEAWIMMQNEVSGNFLFGLIKRARKYGVGVTTITQDVEDFLKSPYGKPIISNASIQILLKQSTASIKSLENTFGLSEAEKQKLVSSNVGEGLFFAGNQHVAIKIIASSDEKEFITTDV
ncbi:MAG: DUF87 domain-containing protein, partial [Candidatus Absconditabacteria bacterium]